MMQPKNTKIRIIVITALISLVSGYFISGIINKPKEKTESEGKVLTIYPPDKKTFSEPAFPYIMALKLHKELQRSSGHYTDTLINSAVSNILHEFNFKTGLDLIRCDSTSYEVIASPRNFNMQRDFYYLLTPAHIYLLKYQLIEFYNDSLKTHLDFP